LSQFEYQASYRRHLPHVQSPGGTLFITFRLADSIPDQALETMRQETQRIDAVLAQVSDQRERERRAYAAQRRLFGQWDAVLDASQSGPMWLRDARIAGLVSQSCHHHSSREYELDAFCIMPNHVHLICTPLAKADGTYHAMSVIMHSLKGYTAHEANQILGRRGAFWQHENYDHAVRSEDEWRRIIAYVLNNPVKAGLADHADDWEWSYCRQL
jgi:putative transposase